MNVVTLSPTDLISEELTTTSLKVAEVFDKKHPHILEKIRNVECSEEFGLSNFRSSSYINSQNKEQSLVEMTKDGFIFLVMGFTGKKAAGIKEKYIEAFNWMEQQLRDGAMCVPVTPQHKADHMVSGGRTFKALFQTARMMGMDRPRATRAANVATERATGVNLIRELDADDLLETPLEQIQTQRAQLENQLRDWVAEQSEPFAMNDVIAQGLNQDPAEVGHGTRTAIGVALKQLGFIACKVRQGGGFGYVYKRIN